MDVKFLKFRGKQGRKVKRYQFTAIDFVDYVIDKFAFRLREIRSDNGHDFQARFHWHVEDKDIRHAYFKPSSRPTQW